MSLILRDDLGPAAGAVGRQQREAEEIADIERRLVLLVDEVGRLIDGSPRSEREVLRGYAVGLLRDRHLDVSEEAPDPTSAGLSDTTGPVARTSQSATLIGYGILLFPASAVLLLVFPPVGVVLFATGLALFVLGTAAAILGKLNTTAWKRA